VALTGRTELEHAGGSTASVADGASGVAPAEPAATEAEPRSADSAAASAFVSPDFAGSAPLQASGEQAASTTESRERQRGESPAL
jgi:hypothetical protein